MIKWQGSEWAGLEYASMAVRDRLLHPKIREQNVEMLVCVKCFDGMSKYNCTVVAESKWDYLASYV